MSFFGGDDPTPPPPPPRLPPPPKPQEIMDVIDEISGTRSMIVTENGRKVRKIIKLPRSAEEQKFLRLGEEIISEGLASIKQLYQYNPQNVASIQPLINTIANLNERQIQDLSQITNFGNLREDVESFRTMQKDLLNEDLLRAEGNMENDLARMGRAGGTYGAAQRAYFAKESAMARRQGDFQALQYGQDLTRQRLGTNLAAYEARQQGRANELRAAETEYSLNRQRQADLENLRQSALSERMNQINIGSSLRGADLSRQQQGNATQMALYENDLRNRNQQNDYNNRFNVVNQDYQNQLGYHQAMTNYNKENETGFGQALMTGAGLVGGSMLLGPAGSGGNKLFGKLFG